MFKSYKHLNETNRDGPEADFAVFAIQMLITLKSFAALKTKPDFFSLRTNLDALGVGDGQVVADNLDVSAASQGGPAVPVIL